MEEQAKIDKNYRSSSLAITEDTKEIVRLKVNSITDELLVAMDLTPRVDTGTPKTRIMDDNNRDVAKVYDEVNDEIVPLLVDENSNLLVDTIIN